MTTVDAFVTSADGLSAAQVAERVAAGRTNAADVRTSRTIGQIVRANVITPFNGLLFTLFLVILATGRWQNGLFGLVIVANSGIGVVQEVRAKRTLDRLAVLNAPRARVMRDGAVREIAVEDVVADELLELRTGDQVAADGVVTMSTGLEIDESLLTGESDPVAKTEGSEVRSGSIVVAGTGRFQATAIGAEAYATALAAEARRFTLVKSELVSGTNTLLRWISLMMLVVGPLLLWSQFRSDDNNGWRDAVTGAVAALVGMVPEGLVLLTSLAFVIAAVSLTRRQTLVQELPAVEVLARVDVVCLDKTGTLTHGDVVFDELQPLDGGRHDDVPDALALSSSGADANATAAALAANFPSTTWTRTGGIPFSSARKWSAVSARRQGDVGARRAGDGAAVAVRAGRARGARAGEHGRCAGPAGAAALGRAGRPRRRAGAARAAERAGAAGAGRARRAGARGRAGHDALLHRAGRGAQGHLRRQPAHRRRGRRVGRRPRRDQRRRRRRCPHPARGPRRARRRARDSTARSDGSPRIRSARWWPRCSARGMSSR